MTETHLQSITNKWNLDAHIGSYIFYEDLYWSKCITTYVVPFVIGMLLAGNEIERSIGYRRSNLGQVTYRLTKGIVYGID